MLGLQLCNQIMDLFMCRGFNLGSQTCCVHACITIELHPQLRLFTFAISPQMSFSPTFWLFVSTVFFQPVDVSHIKAYLFFVCLFCQVLTMSSWLLYVDQAGLPLASNSEISVVCNHTKLSSIWHPFIHSKKHCKAKMCRMAQYKMLDVTT